MMFVSEVLKAKTSEKFTTIGPEEPLYGLIPALFSSSQAAFAVVQNDRLVGVLTRKNIEQYRAAFGAESALLTVRQVMERGLPEVRSNNTVDECMNLMLEKSVSHLPVTSDGRYAGLIAIADVVRSAMQEKEFVIAQLVGYITESRGGLQTKFAYA